MPDAAEVRSTATRATSAVRDNPLALGLLSAAAGFGFGMVIQLSRYERQRLPALADKAKRQATHAMEGARQTGVDAATSRAEDVAHQAIEEDAQAAKNIPGTEEAVDKLEKSSKQGARTAVRKARGKAT